MISIIAAVAQNGCIGLNGTLPWHIPEDFVHFKTLTIGKTVLMGRKTWESLPGKFRPLPGRANVVISRSTGYNVPPGVVVFPSVEEACIALGDQDTWVIGGAQIFTQTIDRADRLIITHVDRVVDGDAFFPEIDAQRWSEVAREDHDGFSFVTYERVRTNAPSRVDNEHTGTVI